MTLCDPMDCSLPGSSVHGILQTRILEWVGIPFSRRTSQPRVWNPGLLHCRLFTIQEVKCQTEKKYHISLIYGVWKTKCTFKMHTYKTTNICLIKMLYKTLYQKKTTNTIQYWTSPISTGLLLQLYIQSRISCQLHWLEIY